jgi:CDP-glucose 4,6-dehydratase
MEALVNPSTFWRGKSVLLTGHTGFKGSWLALWLQGLGARVTGYSLPPPTEPSLFDLARIGDGIVHRIGDIRDLPMLAQVIVGAEPEVVFHLAAQSLVRPSYVQPVETYATNVMGTVNVLEAIRRAPSVRSVVIVTSDKCYENREWLWGYRENDPMGGHDPYSSSKGCAELVVTGYRNSFFPADRYGQHGVAVATARAGNVIAGGDWSPDRLVPDIMQALLTSDTPLIRNPRAIRPWQHVLEALHGYLMLAEKLLLNGPQFGGGWNFGPPDEDTRPVGWVAERLCALWGAPKTWNQQPGEHAHEAHVLRLDTSKARNLLGWSPRWKLDHTLERIVAWYRGHERKADLRQSTEAEISAFEATAPIHAKPEL